MGTEEFKRRLTAILSADVEGYSRLMREDEEATVRTITTYRTAMTHLIQQYRGRVVDSPGDNILAEFTSVVDTVNCSVEIQRELAERNAELPENSRMRFRIGINLGDVLEEGDRIYGDGVNIAARMESLAEAGEICISGTVYDAIENKIGLEYEYLGEHEVKNIDKPIRAYRVLSYPGAAAHRVVKAKKAVWKNWRNTMIAIVAVLVVGASLVWNFYFRTSLPQVEPASVEKMAFPLPDKPSIAVLPFDNLSGDEGHEVLVDGLTEDIITALARFNQLFVIARNSTFTYKGKPVKVQQVAEDLGVRYVLEGSIQISGNRLRVTAQLIDAITGSHVWVERFDRSLKDVFAVQDDLTEKLVGSLVGKLDRTATKMALLNHPNSLDAYGLYLSGRELMWKFTSDDNAKGRELIEKAISLDPNYAAAYAFLAFTHFYDWQWYGTATPKETYKKAFDLAHKAVALGPRDAWAHFSLGVLYLYDNRHEQAIAQFEEGMKANPNHADLLAGSADPYVFNGQPEKAVKKAKEGMRLNPYHPGWYLFQLGCAQYIARDYEEAIETLRKMTPLGEARRILAASLAYLGRMDEARAEAERFLKDNPSFSVSKWSSNQPFRYEEDRQHAVYGYIKAGLPKNPPLPLPDKPSIAVLPFVNMSGDPEQEYFSDGITEEIITALSKTPKLFVIARTSSFRYKGKDIDVRTVGRELGVRYVLEGSVRKAGDKVRITAQLIDAKTNQHLWAERYDRDLKDIFAVQDEVTKKIITELQVQLTSGEEARLWARGTNNLEAYLNYLRGLEHKAHFNKEENVLTRKMAEEAIALDPQYSNAYTLLGLTHMMDVWLKTSKSSGESIRKAIELAQKAIALDSSNAAAYGMMGFLLTMARQHEKGIAAAEKAVTLDPNSALAYQFLGLALRFGGRPNDAIPVIEKAIRLDPFAPSNYIFNLGLAYLFAGQHEKAIPQCKKATDREPNNLGAHLALAVAYSVSGRDEEARAVAEEILRIAPKFSVEYYSRTLAYKNQADKEIFITALRKAGLK